MSKVLVIYFSKSGKTQKMAEFIKEGLDSVKGIDVVLKKVQETALDDLLSSDAIIIGSPTYFGVMATEVKDLMDKSIKHYGKLAGKVGGVFTSSDAVAGGNETTLFSIIQGLLIHDMIIPGSQSGNHYGPVSIGEPDERIHDDCVKYGKVLGELTLKLS